MVLENLKQELADVINKYLEQNVSIDGAYYVLKDLFNEMTLLFNNALAEERKTKLVKIEEDIEEEDK